MRFVFLFLMISSSAFAQLETLVEIQSTYNDNSKSSSNGKVKIKGSGWLFALKGKVFVFTASHVSQGQDTEIFVQKAKLNIVNRIRSEKMDVEIFQVSGIAPEQVNIQAEGPYFRVTEPLDSNKSRWMDSFNYVPVHEWIKDPHMAADSTYYKTKATTLFMDAFSNLLNTEALVQPGMSGAPLITVVPLRAAWKSELTAYDFREDFDKAVEGGHYVRGLVIRRDRFFSSSSFIPVYRIKEMFMDWGPGKIKPATFNWEASGAILLRKEIEPGGIVEGRYIGSATAGGLMVDGGNGVSMDGGDGPSLHENSPIEFLEKVSAYPYLENKPAFYWLLAMRSPTTPGLMNSFSWFDFEYHSVLRRFIFALTPEDPEKGLQPLDMIRVRIGKKIPFTIEDKEKSLIVTKDSMEIKFQTKDQDTVQFKMDRAGRICKVPPCQGFFVPIIEVESLVKKKTYILDLRSLFFTDFSVTKTLSLRSAADPVKDDDDYQKRVWREVDEANFKAQFLYRLKSDLPSPRPSQELLGTVVQFK